MVITSTSSVHVRRFLRDIDVRAEVLVIGDLSREDAIEFWEKYLPTNNPSTPVPTLHLNFDDVYVMYLVDTCFTSNSATYVESVLS